MNGSGIIPLSMTKERRAELAVAKAAGDDKKLQDLFQKQEEDDMAMSSKGGEKGFQWNGDEYCEYSILITADLTHPR